MASIYSGYCNDWREMNSADFGAYTSRNRLFGCFAKYGFCIVWPEATHAKKVHGGMFGTLKPWKAVKHVLDFKDEGESIFNRSERGKKELVEATLKRIYAGLIKHVAGGQDKFLLKYNSMSKSGRHTPPSVNEPCPTVACQGRLGIAFISKYFSGAPENKNITVEGPAGTIKTKDSQALVQAFIMKYYGNGDNTSSVNQPAGTVTTKDRMSKVWLDKQYGGDENHQSVNKPAGVIMQNDKHCLMEAKWITDFSFSNKGKSIEEPAQTLLASRHHTYIINPSYGWHISKIENPCPVIIARQDKSPLSLMITISGHAIPIYEVIAIL